ncbi:DNA replication regulator Sld3 [Macrophomina phaseolina MS6]|uniref:DNA replication regulator Sld3 n=1 Tax=Macrophomina phaseolina (strain MS6) TaxID=1126212 RepID=K2RM99_MACPH|nr:DNA replication regulator Sld3 [Macrophomina phaseolina MS6]
MDKKHRERLPEIIKSMPLPGLSDDEDVMKTKKAKKSKSKRLKPSKEGMYPGEEDHVKRWWLQDRPGSSPSGQSESPADALKRRLGELRVRESMAQVILVLETMALEASFSFQAADQDETQQDETQAESQAAPAKKRKLKKPQDLNVLLDLLLDRLAIWQSVEQDETLTKVSKAGSGKNDTLTPNSSKTGTSDRLKNFCVEVILPFYMSRLPEKAAAINRRLGGPSASPAKASGSGTSSHRSKPGEAAVRTDSRSAQRKRRPLSRVATENAAHQPAHHPSLTRSSTDPTLPSSFKREGSEAPSLSSIPLQQKDPHTSSSRNSLSQFERFSRRTIDLDAMSKTNEAKLKKKAHIESELEKAIGTLRKPNRGAALKDVADSADSRRLATSTRKPTSASRRPGAPVERSAVLVGATPKRARKTKDVAAIQATPNHRWAASLARHGGTPNGYLRDDDQGVLPSSDPVVPSSAVRPSGEFVPGSAVPASGVKGGMPPPQSAARTGGGVEETPSRGPAGKTVRWGLVAGEDEVGVAATPEVTVSKLGERLRAESVGGGSRGGGKRGLLNVPPPPAFKLSGVPLEREVLGRVGEESEGSEDEFSGVAAMLRTPTKAGRQVFETPLKRPVVVGETPVKDETESKGKEKEVEERGVRDTVDGAEMGEEAGEASIYSALGWDDDDDVDELA